LCMKRLDCDCPKVTPAATQESFEISDPGASPGL
jgi:hypothetical protein